MRWMLLLLTVIHCPLLMARVWEVGEGKSFPNIRPALTAALEGDTINVYSGTYTEGNLVIDRQISLIGIGYPVLDGQFTHELITIKARGVRIEGFHLKNSGQMSTIDIAAIKVLAADGVVILRNQVTDCNFGIYLSNVRWGRIESNMVTGSPKEEQNTGNGIHLWKCDSAVITGNQVRGHRDGIYFEFVTHSTVTNNHSEGNIRYGLHFMFSHNDTYIGNLFRKNGAGVAVMYSHHVIMGNNDFEENLGAAAYGILLKDISDSHIYCNRFLRNSAALYLEGSNRIDIERNLFLENGWALRVQASCIDNTIRHNQFQRNSFDVATNGQVVLNSFNSNYWDHYEGYDLNKDGRGDVPFRPVSLFSSVAEQMPYALLFLRSLAMYLLDRAERWMPSLTPPTLTDESPFMAPILDGGGDDLTVAR